MYVTVLLQILIYLVNIFNLLFKENAQPKSEIPGAGIADVQLQLYNVNQDNHHSLTNMCMSQEFPDIHFTGNGVQHNGTSEDSKKVYMYMCLHFALVCWAFIRMQ